MANRYIIKCSIIHSARFFVVLHCKLFAKSFRIRRVVKQKQHGKKLCNRSDDVQKVLGKKLKFIIQSGIGTALDTSFPIKSLTLSVWHQSFLITTECYRILIICLWRVRKILSDEIFICSCDVYFYFTSLRFASLFFSLNIKVVNFCNINAIWAVVNNLTVFLINQQASQR